MRLISYRAAGGHDGLGVATLERWLPAATLLPDGPTTMDELLTGDPDRRAALAATAASEARVKNVARFFEIVRRQSALLRDDRLPFLVDQLDTLIDAGDDLAHRESAPAEDAWQIG